MKCRAGRFVAFVLAVSVWSGCSLEDPRVPALTSPSGFGAAVTLTAFPDSLPRDGSAQSIVTVTVRDASNIPAGEQRLTVSANIGTVSESEIVNDGDGNATFAFTAPDSATVGNAALIQVVPISTGGEATQPRVLTIALTGASNSTVPIPAFTVTPTAPQESVSVRFDASTTEDEGTPCLDVCTYSWNFGDGSTGTGRTIDHVFSTAGTYTVTLAVTDAAGTSASTAQAVTVGNIAAPTVTLAVGAESPDCRPRSDVHGDCDARDRSRNYQLRLDVRRRYFSNDNLAGGDEKLHERRYVRGHGHGDGRPGPDGLRVAAVHDRWQRCHRELHGVAR